MAITSEELYAQREKRFNDVVALEKPDRVPVIPLVVHYFPTKIRGISNRDAGYDNALRYKSAKEATVRFGWDFGAPSGLFASGVLEALGIAQIKWPGGGLADDSPFQFVEKEWMAEEEYDEFLAAPDLYTQTNMIPRIATALAGLGGLQLPPFLWFSNSYNLAAIAANLVAAPPMRGLLESLLRVADAADANSAALGAHVGEMAGLGYPYTWAVATIPAFDMVSDFFRGLKGGSLDIYRNPDRLLAAVELMQPVSVGSAIAGARMTGNPRVFIPMHRGADGFMNEEAFEKFYWPTFKELIEALVEAGLTPAPLFEGGYESRLKYLAELPPGKVAAHFDHIDPRKFKEICGDVMCFWGNVPASLLCTGSPGQVKDHVKGLIELFGDTGALIIDGNQGIPDEARPENVLALREAADEYGIY